MKHVATRLSVLGSLAVLALALSGSPASASFPLRSPQVTFQSASLQAYLNGVGETINVTTDQLDLEVWTASVSGNATFTLMVELAANAPFNNLGVYNAGAPATLFQVFPGAAAAGWYAVASFQSSGNLVVSLFDNNSVFQGSTTYSGVNGQKFGFYLQGPGGQFYTEDARNGGKAQALTYAGTGRNFGDWWLCWEDLPYAAATSDFEDAVLLLQSSAPVPATATTWGAVKARYET